MGADALSLFTNNGNHNTTHKSNYIREIMSKFNKTDKLP